MTEFATQGHEPFPALQRDEVLIHEVANWSLETLESRIHQYMSFLQDKPMPRAKVAAERILDHLMFELAFRDGVYDEPNEDELCEET